LLRETAASGQKAARDINVVRTAAVEQRLVDGRAICALEEEMGQAREAVAEIRRLQGRQEDERKAATHDLHKKAQGERSEVSG
jgi:hypothetical protein